MTTLLELAPRCAGSDTVEADIEFPDTLQLHEVNACLTSCYCGTDSAYCYHSCIAPTNE
ncbi:hypothetical protein [Nocardia arthritidis]|uniref:Uncharacterized protein n=1 Tax=Nocardia arthritidis TaxID=228602 RepID=A0A6G9Y946_9NOCA|nr:hypothetical protein [Nocardia arthritidis]QIS09698.1 hypothetical protein F5544_08985 [Nocardia arthritidis]